LINIPYFYEYKDSLPIQLSLEEIKFLRETIPGNENDAKINIKPTACKGEFVLHATSYVGTIKTPNHTITIKPKIGNMNFFKMLLYSEKLLDLPSFENEIEIEEGEDLVDFMAKLFDESIAPIIQEGIYRNYTSNTEEIPTIRGKLLIVQNIRNPRISKEKFFCEYDEFSADILENQILLYCSQLLSELVVDKNVKEKLVQTQQFLQKEGVSEKFLDMYHLEQITYQKFNEHYEKILKLCEFILRITWYGDFLNNEEIPIHGFLYNMNTLFQDFITVALKEQLSNYNVKREPKDSKLLKNKPIISDGIPTKSIDATVLKPDIVIKNRTTGKTELVIDTKYKDHDPPAGDYYQSLAYALTLECPVLLLLPQFDIRRKEDFELIQEVDKEVLISVRTIDLSGDGDGYIELIKSRLEEIVKPMLKIYS
jgi:5-methylcytosine-specific restriction enzyme subunit McrC